MGLYSTSDHESFFPKTWLRFGHQKHSGTSNQQSHPGMAEHLRIDNHRSAATRNHSSSLAPHNVEREIGTPLQRIALHLVHLTTAPRSFALLRDFVEEVCDATALTANSMLRRLYAVIIQFKNLGHIFATRMCIGEHKPLHHSYLVEWLRLARSSPYRFYCYSFIFLFFCCFVSFFKSNLLLIPYLQT